MHAAASCYAKGALAAVSTTGCVWYEFAATAVIVLLLSQLQSAQADLVCCSCCAWRQLVGRACIHTYTCCLALPLPVLQSVALIVPRPQLLCHCICHCACCC